MRSDQAKTIPIDLYLALRGHKPANIRLNGRELWYQSPIRKNDETPSFKVDTVINKWFDHGLGRGGNTLDLAIEFCRGSVRDALHELERSNLYKSHGYTQSNTGGLQHIGSFIENRRPAVEKEKMESTAFRLVRENELKHPALLQYLETRKIDLNIAQKYLKEIRFEPAQGDKLYFALGWPNGSGYEARNSLFKGFVGTGKDVTYLKQPNASECFIFEGFMDFLSFLSENKLTKLHFSVIILNSGALKARALPFILESGYRKIHLFMDNDEMGTECSTFFEGTLGSLDLIDHRPDYAGYKDFNAKVMSQADKSYNKNA